MIGLLKQTVMPNRTYFHGHPSPFHGSEDKVLLLKWKFLKVKGLCRKTVVFQWKQIQLNTMGVLFLLSFVPTCFSPLFFRKFLKLLTFQATEKLEDVQSTARLPGPPPRLCPAVRGWTLCSSVVTSLSQSRDVNILSFCSIPVENPPYNDPKIVKHRIPVVHEFQKMCLSKDLKLCGINSLRLKILHC